MATIQEMQKARELMKTQWLDLKTAVAQARTPVTPVATLTPVTPAPTAPAPIAPTVNVQEQMSGMNVAERQAIRSGTPAPVTTPAPVAPVSPNTPAPVQNVSDTAPITPKVDATPWITQDSFNQAQAKSAEIKAQNDAVMAQNKQKSELATQERQQIAKETAQASIPTDQKGIVNALISGMSVAEQPTQAYRNALVVSNQFKKFNGMTEVQLLDNLKQGQIGTELDSLLSQNPNYAKAKAELAKVQKTASINRATRIASNVISWKETPVVDDLANIEAKYQPPLGANAQAYQDYVVQNPDVVSAGSQVKQLSTQISDLTKSYNDALKSIKSQYGDMPASALLTLMGSRTSETKELLDSYINAKELAKGDFDMAMKMAEGSYGAYTKDREEQQQIAQEQRQMQNTLALWQAQFDQKIAQQTQTMNDPTTAIGWVIKQFSDLGIVGDRDLAWHVAEQKRLGMTLPEYTKKMIEDFKAKPEYQQALTKKANEWVSFQTIGDKVYKVKDGQLIDMGISTAKAEKWTFVKWEDGNWINTTTKEIINEKDLISQQTSDKLNTYFNSVPVWSKWGQCGAWANKNPVAIANWFRFGDSYQSKLDQTNSKEGAIGAFAIWNPGGVTKANWHVWQIVWESQDGNSWIIRDSNFSNNPKDETVREHAVSKSVIEQTGWSYAVPWLWKKWIDWTVSDSDIALFNSAKYNPQTDKDKARAKRYEDFQNKAAEIMSDPNAKITDKMRYSKWAKDLAESPNKSYKDMGLVVSQLDRLWKSITDYDKKSFFWSSLNPIAGLIANNNPWDTKAQEIKTQLTQLVPKIARWVFWEVGVLTDQDIANYIQTLPNIKQTADVQDVVQLALLATVRDSLNNSLSVDSATYDTSWLIGNYKKLDSKIQELQNRVTWTTSAVNKTDFLSSIKQISEALSKWLSWIK